MWRMNGFCRAAAVVVLLYSLLLTNGALCQDEATDAPAADPLPNDDGTDAGAVGTPHWTAPPDAGAPAVDDTATLNLNVDSLIPELPSDAPFIINILTFAPNADSPNGDQPSDASDTNASPVVVPVVRCVGKEDIEQKTAVKFAVITNDCSSTKDIIQNNPAAWCRNENCHLEIFQEGSNVVLASDDAKPSTLAEALQSDSLKKKLGVSDIQQPSSSSSSSSSSSVFVGILVSGLLAAAAITFGYFKCQRRPEKKGVKLAEEAHPADQENQGNTLVSVAPLNPTPETQEKPSVNGESPEAAKTEPPPTNGHSTAKTADTEL
ncbi:uncharacterized protein si:dkey-261h17.1 [Thalassophryne amazonica]|uniref:uncharacterized protein si:dkey-261h17.1 n=1 Tax=Thalassophryne amazonica TaxID=390379 RepID=UPI001471FF8F|nr:uncharacterized protein si:dkey-261h17.1 [Thalassophryne amazonica]